MTSQHQPPDQSQSPQEESVADAAARLADMLEGASGDPETLADGAPSVAEEPELLEPQPEEADPAAAALQEAQAQLEEAQRQREAAEEEARQMKGRALRAAADLDNFRRRAQKEKADLEKFAIEGLAKDLLEVVDNLERALSHHKPQSDAPDPLFAGVEMVLKQFRQKLVKVGVEGFESQGLPFDPLRHEAIQQVESREHANGTVVTEFQRGYFLHGRLLRPALVVVANNPVVAEAPPAEAVAAEAAPPVEGGAEGEVAPEVEA
jgi:molecular chaperone GrpE